MLQAQVNYWNLVEQKRHNVATEINAADTLAESIRHAKVSEGLESSRLAEIKRHDFASETLESISNRAKMLASQASMYQAETANLRANLDYSVGMAQAQASQTSANAAARNASTNAYLAGFRERELDQQMQAMYAGMMNTGISALGHIGSTAVGNMGKLSSAEASKPKTIYRMIID